MRIIKKVVRRKKKKKKDRHELFCGPAQTNMRKLSFCSIAQRAAPDFLTFSSRIKYRDGRGSYFTKGNRSEAWRQFLRTEESSGKRNRKPDKGP